MTINLIVVALYAFNLWLRTHGAAPGGLPLVLSIVAVAGLGVSGWLGGHMVHVAGVGVVNAPEATGGERPATSAAPARARSG
jgi:uncharacterized membrane protein